MSGEAMELGAFSISLAVADLAASRAFYEKLGFDQTGGDGEHYLIMVNGLTVLGLFQQMFEKNILTFNPGLGQDTKRLEDFSDIRDLRDRLVDAGIEIMDDLDPEGTGPASITFLDPDGNPVLIDQFFPGREAPRTHEDATLQLRGLVAAAPGTSTGPPASHRLPYRPGVLSP